MTGVTRRRTRRRYMGRMKPLHLAVLITAVMSYFALSALIAAPQLFGLSAG